VPEVADCPVLLILGEKITASHRARDAYVYVRQSTLLQVQVHTESLARQYDLRQRATALGWPAHQVVVIDEDLGRSGASAAGRSGFSELVADVGLGKTGIILVLEVSRLARSNADWYQLLGAPRGAVYSCGDGRAPPPGRRSGGVKLEAAVRREVA
jgi:Resolvase, N terminal domain